jgi:glycosyltransferase involved in cell wall biosynthesis
MGRLTVIIPSYREPYLQRTIDDIRSNAETDVEIIAVLDGYRAPVLGASTIELNEHKGMRNAINLGVSMARGTHVMKVDGHCSFGKGFDRIILETIQDDWVVIPRRYALDPEKWELLPDRPIDYEKLIIHKTRNKFHGEEWRYKKGPDIDETMAFQGSCWTMSKKLLEKVVPLDDANYGPFVQEPVEISMKVWQAGGKLMVNKHTWYAHKHRSFSRTHNVNKEEADIGNVYAMNTYGEYYESVIKPRFL